VADVAVVHDFLTQFGGAERVALMLSETYPDAPIFTSVYQPGYTFSAFENKAVESSFLQRVLPEGHFRYGAPLYGMAFSRFDLSDFDAAVVSSSGFAHHVHHPKAFIYCHTPPRFIYRINTYFSNKAMITAMAPFLPWLRAQDQKAAARHRNYVANSRQTAALISEVYGKTAPVIHPPLDTARLNQSLSKAPESDRALVLARLQPYKRIDLAIAACRRIGLPLTIVGEGPERAKLRELAAGADVTFMGRLADSEIGEVIDSHSLLLVPGIEDFGLTPSEANYAGRPVIARAAGGALETVRDGVNGLLVDSEDPQAWAHAIQEGLSRKWDTQALRDSTKPFQLPAFQAAIRDWVAADNS